MSGEMIEIDDGFGDWSIEVAYSDTELHLLIDDGDRSRASMNREQATKLREKISAFLEQEAANAD